MEDEFQSDVEDVSSIDPDEDYLGEDQNYIHNSISKRRSFVWKYFDEIPNNPKAYECSICKASVGAQTCNLGRHLITVHNITGHAKSDNDVKRGRPSRSFIWKYCTRENEKQAFCHLCKKLLYFGGGNTSNIAKHLRRVHADIVENNGEYIMDHNSPELVRATASISSTTTGENIKEEDTDIGGGSNAKKERKGCSYVWKYCIKLSKHSVRCKLCDKVMSFHGTANVITHLQRRHNIVGKSGPDSTIDGPENINAIDLLVEDSGNNKLSQDSSRSARGTATSIVWKYCTRIDKDTVRCGFCKKNLSYQGTSNLQRHLHRLHGVVSTPRSQIDLPASISLDSVGEYYTTVNSDKIKCNMCNTLFDVDDSENIYKHVVVTHGVSASKRQSAQDSDEITYVEVFDELDEETLIKGETIEVSSAQDQDNKPFDMFYEDIIEEDVNEIMNDEQEILPQPKDDMIQLDIMNNPLSPQSSEDRTSPIDEKFMMQDSKRMIELKEERIRMQAEYFREKAAFFRMQKYLTALQAKKVRTEIELINSGQFLTTNISGETETEYVKVSN